MHGRIYIVLKESLRKIPVIGWGIQLSQFILLKRNWEQDKPQLATHLSKLNNILDPMWLLLFPEGTNLAPSTREKSRKWAKENGIQDMEHQLLPRSTGLQFCLQELRETVGYVYDCTIAYEGVPYVESSFERLTWKTNDNHLVVENMLKTSSLFEHHTSRDGLPNLSIYIGAVSSSLQSPWTIPKPSISGSVLDGMRKTSSLSNTYAQEVFQQMKV